MARESVHNNLRGVPSEVGVHRTSLSGKASVVRIFEGRESMFRHPSFRSLEGIQEITRRPFRASAEKSRRVGAIVETLHREREEKIKDQQRFNKMNFESLVSAAIYDHIINEESPAP